MADTFDAGGGGGLSLPGMKLSSATFNDIGGAVNDLFSAESNAESLNIKAQGDLAEAQTYGLAEGLANQNAQFTANSTAIQQMQADRALTMSLGSTKADVASSGFAESGSALDILRDSAQQGALQRQVLTQQGQITEAGYEEQAKSYGIMQSAATTAAGEEEQLAGEAKTAGTVGAVLKGAAAVASIFA